MGKDLIDTELLGKLQNQFCSAHDIYLACVDRDRNVLTSHYGSEEEQSFINDYCSSDVGERLFNAVSMSQVETIVEIDMPDPFIKQCAIINRINGSIALVWTVTAIIEEKIPEGVEVPDCVCRTSEDHFYRAMAFLESLTRQMFVLKEQELQKQEAMEQALAAESLYKEQLHRSEAMASVVRMMECDDSFSAIVDNAVREVCELLGIQGGCLVRVSADGKTIDPICEYSVEKSWSLGDKIQGKLVATLPFFDGKPYMLSSDSMMREDLENFFVRYHLTAGVFQPIEVNERNDMYLCFYEFEKERIWNMDDIKFINDVRRVIQGILERRIAKNSLAGSFASLEAILENVGCAIYVVDYDNEEVLYTNQYFRQMIVKNVNEKGIRDYFFEAPSPQRVFNKKEHYLTKSNLWVDMNQVEITWVDGRTVCLGTIYDITDRKSVV